jgi:hypothetical protein
MALNWKTVNPEHVARACKVLLEQGGARNTARGIFILYEGKRLPAKHATRLAYCFANGLAPDTKLKFSSGEAMANLLRRLSFTVEHLGRK